MTSSKRTLPRNLTRGRSATSAAKVARAQTRSSSAISCHLDPLFRAFSGSIEVLAQPADQLLEFERLLEKHRPGQLRMRGRDRLRDHQDDRDAPVHWVPLHSPKQLRAGDDRHHLIGDHGVGNLLGQDFQRPLAVRRRQDCVSLVGEERCENLDDGVLVVDEKDGLHGPFPLPRLSGRCSREASPMPPPVSTAPCAGKGSPTSSPWSVMFSSRNIESCEVSRVFITAIARFSSEAISICRTRMMFSATPETPFRGTTISGPNSSRISSVRMVVTPRLASSLVMDLKKWASRSGLTTDSSKPARPSMTSRLTFLRWMPSSNLSASASMISSPVGCQMTSRLPFSTCWDSFRPSSSPLRRSRGGDSKKPK